MKPHRSPAKAFNEALHASKIKDLATKRMSAKELCLPTSVIQALKTREVITPVGKTVERSGRYFIWGPGPKYKFFIEREGHLW